MCALRPPRLIIRLFKMKKIVIFGLFVVVVVVAAFFVFGKDSGNETTTSSCQPANTQTETSGNVIKLEANGFSPRTLTIKAGDSVTFINEDTEEHWPASDDHPAHQIYPGFDPKRALCPSERWSFKFDRAGTWGMHDHLFSSLRGTIIVE